MKTGPKKRECWSGCGQIQGPCNGCDSSNDASKGACCKVIIKGHHREYDPLDIKIAPICKKAPVKMYAAPNYHVCVAVGPMGKYDTKGTVGPRPMECWKQCKSLAGYCDICDSKEGERQGACCGLEWKFGKRFHVMSDPPECKKWSTNRWDFIGYHSCIDIGRMGVYDTRTPFINKAKKLMDCWAECGHKSGPCLACASKDEAWQASCCRADFDSNTGKRKHYAADPQKCKDIPVHKFAATGWHVFFGRFFVAV